MRQFYLDDYHALTAVNIDAVVYGFRASLPALRRAGGGSIVAGSSLAALTGFRAFPLYTMTRAAVVGLVRSLAPTWAEENITAGAVCPAFTDTPLLRPMRGRLQEAGFPLLEPGTVADVVIHQLTAGGPGAIWGIQSGKPPFLYRHPGVPRPAGLAPGMLPPDLTGLDGGRAETPEARS
ncbi:SDR family NAD(P)-dependent oxidoreductase [Streptomyces monticola]|uniref:SDR family NAD(P)-dependent oxidoreductase n=1 Tax=Streptomyces monticola TaxID=2666263 RepID=A0ABW2JR58_9ACTN